MLAQRNGACHCVAVGFISIKVTWEAACQGEEKPRAVAADTLQIAVALHAKKAADRFIWTCSVQQESIVIARDHVISLCR